MGFPVAGGSVLVCCTLNDVDTTPHGYVREYHLYQTTIRQQLAQMYANRQRRLGIAIPYFAGGDTFALDSTHGQLTIQDGANLKSLITDAANDGFVEFLIEMIPEWTASYANWLNPEIMGQGNVRAWQPLVYAMCLEFTVAVDDLVRSTGVAYHMDLCAECEHVPFGSRLWSDWCALKGNANGVLGFSMIPAQRVVDLLPKLYANGLQPMALSVHPYGPPEMSWSDFKKAMKAAGYWQGYVIGETSCNQVTDPTIATDQSDLFWLLQWPVVSGVTPDGVAQDRLTMEYSAYSAIGL